MQCRRRSSQEFWWVPHVYTCNKLFRKRRKDDEIENKQQWWCDVLTKTSRGRQKHWVDTVAKVQREHITLPLFPFFFWAFSLLKISLVVVMVLMLLVWWLWWWWWSCWWHGIACLFDLVHLFFYPWINFMYIISRLLAFFRFYIICEHSLWIKIHVISRKKSLDY